MIGASVGKLPFFHSSILGLKAVHGFYQVNSSWGKCLTASSSVPRPYQVSHKLDAGCSRHRITALWFGSTGLFLWIEESPSMSETFLLCPSHRSPRYPRLGKWGCTWMVHFMDRNLLICRNTPGHQSPCVVLSSQHPNSVSPLPQGSSDRLDPFYTNIAHFLYHCFYKHNTILYMQFRASLPASCTDEWKF